MDADFIVLKDLSSVLSRLSDHDLISYATVTWCLNRPYSFFEARDLSWDNMFVTRG